jgi:hypothetical protein
MKGRIDTDFLTELQNLSELTEFVRDALDIK